MAFAVAPAEIHRDLCTERGAGGWTCAKVSADRAAILPHRCALRGCREIYTQLVDGEKNIAST